MSETLISKAGFVSKLLKSKKFRDSYCYELIRTGTSFQMRSLREERGWTQADLAQATGKPRSVITRLESPKYGKLSLASLLEIASGFDVALMVKFVPFSRLVREYEDLSPEALSAKSVSDSEEIAKLQEWATSAQRIDLVAALKRQTATQLKAIGTAMGSALRVIEGTNAGVVQRRLDFDRPRLIASESTAGASPVITREGTDTWQKIQKIS